MARALKARIKKQTARISKVEGLSKTEVTRRATAQAGRHHARAKQSKSSNANVRAQATQARVTPRTKKEQVTKGKALRSARMSAGTSLGTGAAQSALKTGRKAIKASLRKGTTGAQSGRKALKQLAAMDPTTRRGLVGATGKRAGDTKQVAKRRAAGAKGGLKNLQGQDLSKSLKGTRQTAAGVKRLAAELSAKKIASSRTKTPAKKATPRRQRGTGAR